MQIFKMAYQDSGVSVVDIRGNLLLIVQTVPKIKSRVVVYLLAKS